MLRDRTASWAYPAISQNTSGLGQKIDELLQAYTDLTRQVRDLTG